MPYYVYMLLCEGNRYYTGYTRDLDKRVKLHRAGKGARYTKMHKPKKIAYVEQYAYRAQAMRREKKIKKLSHSQKTCLAKSKKRISRSPYAR